MDATIWTGRTILVWGWASSKPARNVLFGFDPKSWRWERLAQPTITPRSGAAVAWTGSELLVFGGQDRSGRTLLDGATYDLAANRWRPLPTVPRFLVPSGSTVSTIGTAAVWADGDFYVWISHEITETKSSNTVHTTIQALRWHPGAHRWHRGPIPPRGVSLYEATVMSVGTRVAILDGSACLPLMSCPAARLTGKSAFFDPSTRIWSLVPSGAVFEQAGSFVSTDHSLVAVRAISDDGGYVLGGYAAALGSTRQRWAQLPLLPVPKASPSGPVVSGALWTDSELIDSNLVLVPRRSPVHGFVPTTLTTAAVSACPPISFPDWIGTFCGPAPGPGNGNGPAGSCLGTETAPPCGSGMVSGKYYSYTLVSSCTNAYIDGRWWKNELPGGTGAIDVWMAVDPGESGAGWISPSGAVGFSPTSSTGCAPTS